MKDRNIIDQIGEDVVLLDEDGKENTFEHILTFMYEGKKYVSSSNYGKSIDVITASSIGFRSVR